MRFSLERLLQVLSTTIAQSVQASYIISLQTCSLPLLNIIKRFHTNLIVGVAVANYFAVKEGNIEEQIGGDVFLKQNIETNINLF